MEKERQKMNTAILWDIENVTPPAESNYIQLIIDTISETGSISYAMAFGDWNKNNIKNIAAKLAANSFELIHVPASRKDSSDMSMVAHGVELIFQYPHIERYVLITGDADFRPLLLSLRKYGKETLIICDVTRNASEDLLKMADDYLDYREIVAEAENDDDDDDDGKSGGAKAAKKAEPKMSKQQAFELFEEAVRMLGKTKNLPAPISTVKVRMKLLNAAFDERRLGFRNWKTFVGTAVKKTHVRYAGIDEANLTLDGTAAERKPEVFTALLTILPQADGGEDSGWIRFDEVAQKFDYRKFGYKKFKNLALDAEKRDLIETKNNGNIWQMRQK